MSEKNLKTRESIYVLSTTIGKIHWRGKGGAEMGKTILLGRGLGVEVEEMDFRLGLAVLFETDLQK